MNRQSERYAREGIDLSLSTLADQVGVCAAALKPVHALIKAHVLAADRLHADDTTVPILAKGKTDTGRIWTYVAFRKSRTGVPLIPGQWWSAPYCETEKLRANSLLVSSSAAFSDGVDMVFSYSSGVR